MGNLLLAVVILPYRISVILGQLLGAAGCFLFKKYRSDVDANLRRAFPEKTIKEIRKVRNDTFRNTGMNLIEFGLINFRARKFWLKRISINGKNIMEKLLREKKGIVYLTAHIGNWELMGAYLAMLGFPINVVARKIYDPRLNWLLVTLRKRHRVNTIYRSGRENMKKMIYALKKGQVLGVLIDQDTKVGGVFVDFFGRPAYTPTAITQFARVKNTRVVPGFIYRKNDLSQVIEVFEPMPGGDDEKKETQEYTKVIENFIRKHPSQWVWMHPRWKSSQF